MREILFRGYSSALRKWIYGDLSHTTDKTVHISNEQSFIGVKPETVGQYTGLVDKNGKKIFEGDICHLVYDWHDGTFGDWCAVVEFGNPNGLYNWGWQLKWISGEKHFNPDILLWVEMDETGATCEVIGNIHDNPELLEAER